MSGGVALTFDDGPDPVWTPRVLGALAAASARATFFVVGPLAERHSGLLDQARGAGHGISLHCTEHRRHDRLTEGEIEADARSGLDTLRRLGHEPEDWRPPWGLVTPGTRRTAGRLGLRLVGWTSDSEDWRGDPAGTMLARLDAGLGPDAVVLMHDGVGPGAERAGCGATVDLVGPLVARLRLRGLVAVPVGELGGPVPDRNPGTISGV